MSELTFRHVWKRSMWGEHCETTLANVVSATLDRRAFELYKIEPQKLREDIQQKNEEKFRRQLYDDPLEFYKAIRALRMFGDPVYHNEFAAALRNLEALAERCFQK